MDRAEERLWRLRQGDRELERYVEDFIELSDQVGWPDASLGAVFLMGLSDETIRCDSPSCNYSLSELLNLILYLNGSDFEIEESPHIPYQRLKTPAQSQISYPPPKFRRCPQPDAAGRIPAPNPRPPPRALSLGPPRRPEPCKMAATPASARKMAATPASARKMAATPASARKMAATPASARKMAATPEPARKMAATPASARKMAATPEPARKMAATPEPARKLAPKPESPVMIAEMNIMDRAIPLEFTAPIISPNSPEPPLVPSSLPEPPLVPSSLPEPPLVPSSLPEPPLVSSLPEPPLVPPAFLSRRWFRPAFLSLRWFRPAFLSLRWFRPAFLSFRWFRPAFLSLRWFRPAFLTLRWFRPAFLSQSSQVAATEPSQATAVVPESSHVTSRPPELFTRPWPPEPPDPPWPPELSVRPWPPELPDPPWPPELPDPPWRYAPKYPVSVQHGPPGRPPPHPSVCVTARVAPFTPSLFLPECFIVLTCSEARNAGPVKDKNFVPELVKAGALVPWLHPTPTARPPVN
ncbi:Filamentous hemagglutinin [Labeo rohita]|uniref:Filamentous hemagglutinin n=1 Tax=Labeo rohita TaxID=84645 RepID=A0ABQ8LXK8_LABRO|nr:Filamentous hemagglutinin [Labeo rohita]